MIEMPVVTRRNVDVYDVGGTRFLSYHQAQAHACKLALKKWADRIALCRGGEWSQSMVLERLEQDASALGELLLLLGRANEGMPREESVDHD